MEEIKMGNAVLNKYMQWVLCVLMIGCLVLSFGAWNQAKIDPSVSIDYQKIQTMVDLAVVSGMTGLSIPTASDIASGIVIPDVESADNALLNEFLESEFGEEYTAIEDAAEDVAELELEDDDYEVVVDYLKTLIVGLDEDSVEVDVEDVEVKVTALGLEDDEDKSARVTFEIEVEYELEEGVVEDYKKDLVVVYDVVFDEGDLDDESVELVSIN